MGVALVILVFIMKCFDVILAQLAVREKASPTKLMLYAAVNVSPQSFAPTLFHPLQHVLLTILCFITLVVQACWISNVTANISGTWFSNMNTKRFSAWPITAGLSTAYQAFVTVVLVCNWRRMKQEAET